MKKLKMILVFSLLALTVNAQVSYSSYESYYSEKDFAMNVSDKNNGKYLMYVEMLSMDDLKRDGGIMITERQHEKFMEDMVSAREKYIEWTNVATENGVDNMNKVMPFKTNVGGYFSYGKSWEFQTSVNLVYTFRVIDGSCVLIIRTGRLTAMTNKYMKTDGFIFGFRSESEISNFIDAMATDGVLEFLNKPDVNVLFKD